MRRSEEEGPPGEQLALPSGVSEVGGAGGEQQEAAEAGGGAVLPVVEEHGAEEHGRPPHVAVEELDFAVLHAGERVFPHRFMQHLHHLVGEAALAEDAVQLLLPEDDAPPSDDELDELPPLEDMSDLPEDGA
jgi:hypothetical protein